MSVQTPEQRVLWNQRKNFEVTRTTRWIALLLVVVVTLICVIGAQAFTSQPANEAAVAIDAGRLPPGYRDWRLISVAREEGEFDDIRAVLGNDIAINAYREGTRPFPNGTIIARLAWSYDASEENNKAFGQTQSFVAGVPKNGVQFMVRDSVKYASTGGWGYSQFDDGKPLKDQAALRNCFDCHQAIKDRDFVFTHYAPPPLPPPRNKTRRQQDDHAWLPS